MAKFEGQERRMPKIEACLKEYGFESLDAVKDYCLEKGIDVDKSIRDALVKRHEDNSDPVPEKTLQWEFEEDKKLYATEKLYSVMNFGTENTPYLIKVSRDNTESTPEELIRSNAGFPYNDKTNTIKLSLFGEFTLVD